MKAITIFLLLVSVSSLSIAHPLFPIPEISKYFAGFPVSKLIPLPLNPSKYASAVPDPLKLFSSVSKDGTSNYPKTKTEMETGIQSAVNKDSSNSSNNNSASHVSSNNQVKNVEFAQKYGQQSLYHNLPIPPLTSYYK